MSDPLPDWPDQPNAPLDIGMDEINEYWRGRGVGPGVLHCFADPYDPMLPSLVSGELAPAWKNLINSMGIRAGDVLNCYDFADGARWLSHLLAAKKGMSNPPAFFYIAYNKVNLEEHAVCGCMERRPDRSLLVTFFEPQPTVVNSGFAEEVLKPVTLTDEEVASATDICY